MEHNEKGTGHKKPNLCQYSSMQLQKMLEEFRSTKPRTGSLRAVMEVLQNELDIRREIESD